MAEEKQPTEEEIKAMGSKATQFGGPRANPRNNGGIPRYMKDVRLAIKDLLDPNLSIDDYTKIIQDARTDSGLRGVFATAIVKKNYKVIMDMIIQAYGKPKESIDVTTKGESVNPFGGLTVEELRKLAGKDDEQS